MWMMEISSSHMDGLLYHFHFGWSDAKYKGRCNLNTVISCPIPNTLCEAKADLILLLFESLHKKFFPNLMAG